MARLPCFHYFCRLRNARTSMEENSEPSDIAAVSSHISKSLAKLGTLCYIFNNFKGTPSFSKVVAEAKVAGYTEPDPRDDLSETDVARKVIILARESGLKLELSDIPVESLVSEPLRAAKDLVNMSACLSAEEFMQQLPNFDEDMTKEVNDAAAVGEVLRYAGVVDMFNENGMVEPRRYKREHPFAQLSGYDNIIAFTTTGYNMQPLISFGDQGWCRSYNWWSFTYTD